MPATLDGWLYHIGSNGQVVSDFHISTTPKVKTMRKTLTTKCWVVVQCVTDLIQLLKRWLVLFRVDNIAAENYVNIRYGNIPSLETLAARLDEAERNAMCWCLVVHLKGKFNCT